MKRDKKIILTGSLIITAVVFLIFKLFLQEKTIPRNQSVITENPNLNNEISSSLTNLIYVEKIEEFSNDHSDVCENYKEIQEFEKPVSAIWEAKLTDCWDDCYGALFTLTSETENHKYPHFVGYYPDDIAKYAWDSSGRCGSQIPEKFLKDSLILRIYIEWSSTEYGYLHTVFENKCIPVVKIEKIEIIK